MTFSRQGAVAVLALAFPLVAAAQFEENFDSYRDGDCLIEDNRGGWEGFCGDNRKDACVTAGERVSRPNGLRLNFSDIIRPNIDIGDTKQFRITMSILIPNQQNHNDLFITGYNEYDGDSCQLLRSIVAEFSFEGKVRDGLRRFQDVSISYGSWKELRIDVDLNGSTSLAMYYDGQLVSEDIYLMEGGKKDLVAIGLDSASEVFIDDIIVSIPPVCMYEQTKVKKKKCKDSGCPEKVEGCLATNDAICNSVDDCKKKMKQKLPCNDRRDKGKCVIQMAKCDCTAP